MTALATTAEYRTGKIYDEPIEAYHACPAISTSKLKVFAHSPRLFAKRFVWKTLAAPEPGEPLIVGGAVDALALEGPDEFARRYVLTPEEAPKRPTKKQREAKNPQPATREAIAFWDKFDAEMAGRTQLTPKQWEVVRRCADALHGNKAFAAFHASSRKQVTFRRGIRNGLAMQCRPDLWCEEGNDYTKGMPAIVDVKTIAELPANDPDHLPRHIENFSYHLGAVIYRGLVSAIQRYKADYRPPFILCFVEKDEPHSVVCRPVGDLSLEVGDIVVSDLMAKLHRCYLEDRWPESWDEELTPVDIPEYRIRKLLERTDRHIFG